MGKSAKTYYVGVSDAVTPTPNVQAALRSAQRARNGAQIIYWFALLLGVAALAAAAYFGGERIDARTDLELGVKATAAAGDVAFVGALTSALSAAMLWVQHWRNFGLRHSRASLLWLRRFHRKDANHRLFQRKLARLTPTTFAVTLRDSRVTGSTEQGYRRATPILIIILILAAAIIASWPLLNSYCESAAHGCRAVDAIWLTEFLADEAALADDIRPMALAGALLVGTSLFAALLFAVIHFITPLFGDVRTDRGSANVNWFDRLREEGSGSLMYVVRTADEHWKATVEHVLRRSDLTIYDLSHPSQHLEFELSLLGVPRTGRVAFIGSSGTGRSFDAIEDFAAFVKERAPALLFETLHFEEADEDQMFALLREQAISALTESEQASR